MTVGPTRRQLLTGAAGLSALSLTACTGTRDSALVDRDTVLRTAAAEREWTLLAAYDAALSRAVPADRARLAALRAEHAEHLTALVPSTASPTPTRPPTSPPTSPVPDLAALRALERTTAAEHAGGAVAAGWALAGVLASLSASEASHAVALA